MKKESQLVPFILPVAVFAFVGICLAVFGTLLLQIALQTDTIAPKDVKSLYVIIAALILSALVTGLCAAYALGGGKSRSSDH